MHEGNLSKRGGPLTASVGFGVNFPNTKSLPIFNCMSTNQPVNLLFSWSNLSFTDSSLATLNCSKCYFNMGVKLHFEVHFSIYFYYNEFLTGCVSLSYRFSKLREQRYFLVDSSHSNFFYLDLQNWVSIKFYQIFRFTLSFAIYWYWTESHKEIRNQTKISTYA